jgi:hypothetical protein
MIDIWGGAGRGAHIRPGWQHSDPAPPCAVIRTFNLESSSKNQTVCTTSASLL